MSKNASAIPVTPADLAVLRAARVWLDADVSTLWDAFRPERRTVLALAWAENRAGSAAASFEHLCREHAAQARPDLSRVHSSWWLRALMDEPPSVQRAVTSALPSGIADALRHGLNLTREETTIDRPACKAALQTALALWSERLVGDLAERYDDSPAIIALTRFDTRTFARLINTVGLAKWSLTPEPLPRLDTLDRERFTLFRAALGNIDSRFVRVAERDLAALDRRGPRQEARLGLISVARLLSTVDPHRVRWALQHIPYSTAKSLRSLIGQVPRKTPMLGHWESEILRAAWDVLYVQGRLTTPWEGSA